MIRDSTNAIIGHAVFSLSETANDRYTPPLGFDASFNGPVAGNPGPLLGHVFGARLLKGNGDLLREITVEPGSTNLFVLTPTVLMTDPVVFDEMRQEFLTGKVFAELDTDLPVWHTRLHVPLTLDATGWYRATCD